MSNADIHCNICKENDEVYFTVDIQLEWYYVLIHLTSVINIFAFLHSNIPVEPLLYIHVEYHAVAYSNWLYERSMSKLQIVKSTKPKLLVSYIF